MPEENEGLIEGFADGFSWSCETYRTAYVVCLTCGAAVILHPKVDGPKLHREWHAANDAH